ncbi:MAG: hypothetical protein ACI9XK_005188 [Granulosicoccus sp.]
MIFPNNDASRSSNVYVLDFSLSKILGYSCRCWSLFLLINMRFTSLDMVILIVFESCQVLSGKPYAVN